MRFKTTNEYKEELHPWEPYIPMNSSKLILGTFPTKENNRKAYEFFYPNPKNDFWKVLFAVVGKNLEDYEKEDPIKIRKQVLDDLKLGIGDMGKKILRQKESSKDAHLFPIEYTDIFSILQANPTIKKIIITSSSGGNSSLSWFQQYCTINDIRFEIPKRKLPINTIFTLIDREIKIQIISSTSKLSPIKGDKLYEMYRNAILID